MEPIFPYLERAIEILSLEAQKGKSRLRQCSLNLTSERLSAEAQTSDPSQGHCDADSTSDVSIINIAAAPTSEHPQENYTTENTEEVDTLEVASAAALSQPQREPAANDTSKASSLEEAPASTLPTEFACFAPLLSSTKLRLTLSSPPPPSLYQPPPTASSPPQPHLHSTPTPTPPYPPPILALPNFHPDTSHSPWPSIPLPYPASSRCSPPCGALHLPFAGSIRIDPRPFALALARCEQAHCETWSADRSVIWTDASVRWDGGAAAAAVVWEGGLSLEERVLRGMMPDGGMLGGTALGGTVLGGTEQAEPLWVSDVQGKWMKRAYQVCGERDTRVHELVGVAMALGLAVEAQRKGEVVVYTDCEGALYFLRDVWKKCKIPGRRRGLNKVAAMAVGYSRVLRERGVNVELRLVPGHSGVLGNVKAHQMAGIAAKVCANRQLWAERAQDMGLNRVKM